MLRDEFKLRYSTIPFATFRRNHKKGTITENITSLSHKHKEVELLCILDGKARFYIDMETYEVEKGDIVVISPYLMHNATIFADEDFSHYCLCFDLEIIPDRDLKNELEKGFIKCSHVIKNNEKVSGILEKYVKNAYEAHKEQKNGWELIVSGNMSLFFGVLKGNGFIKNEIKGNHTDICYRIIDYIEQNYSENITSTDVSAAFFVSKSYFCRVFKKNFGYSFQNYICMYRIEKAKILLKTTNMPVSEISMEVGFNSFSYFTKLFREITGCRPLQYRKTG